MEEGGGPPRFGPPPPPLLCQDRAGRSPPLSLHRLSLVGEELGLQGDADVKVTSHKGKITHLP